MGTVNMRVLITGGMGYLGGRLSLQLSEFGHTVIIGTRRAIDSVEWLPSAEIRRTEWHDTYSLLSACEGVDVIVHAAGMNAQACAGSPAAALEFNGVATARLVDAAICSEVKQFLYLSTAHVYDKPLEGLITEETCPRNLHPYATSHLAGERAVLHAAEKYNLEGYVLRLSNAFGAPVHLDADCWKLFINDLCRQCITSSSLVIHGNGGQQRDFIAINDVVKAMVWLIENEISSFSTDRKYLINIGSGSSTSLLDMARLIQSRCEAIFRFKPSIDCSQYITCKPLEYLSLYHEVAKMACDSNAIIEELDQLLLYCKNNSKL